MKHLYILVFSLLCTQLSFAQEVDPNLYDTWYLYSVVGDLGDPLLVQDIDPPIGPILTINPDLSFNGIGACNTFSGQFMADPTAPNFTLILLSFEATDLDCGIEAHNSYEADFFSLIDNVDEEYEYAVSMPTDGEPILTLESPPGFGFVSQYQFEPLSTNETQPDLLTVYPNPAWDVIWISGLSSNLSEVYITDMTGRQQSAELNPDGSINVQHISAGLYFLTLVTEKGQQHIKWIKK